MAKAVLCPVCNGKGIVYRHTGTHLEILEEGTCHGCNSKGWVEVREDTMPPYYYYYYSTYYPHYSPCTIPCYTDWYWR